MGRIVVLPHGDPARLVRHLIHPIGYRLAHAQMGKVVTLDLGWVAGGMPFAAGVFEVAQEFPFLRIHRNHGHAVGVPGLRPVGDMLELGIPVGVLRPFQPLAVGLQAVAPLLQQGRNRGGPRPMPSSAQFSGQLDGTLGRPEQG